MARVVVVYVSVDSPAGANRWLNRAGTVRRRETDTGTETQRERERQEDRRIDTDREKDREG